MTRKLPFYHLKLDVHVMLSIMKGELPSSDDFSSLSSDLRNVWSICCNELSCWNKDEEYRPPIANILSYLEWRLYYATELPVYAFLTPKRSPTSSHSVLFHQQPISNTSNVINGDLMDVYMNMLNNTAAIPTSLADLLSDDKPSMEEMVQWLLMLYSVRSPVLFIIENDEPVLTHVLYPSLKAENAIE